MAGGLFTGGGIGLGLGDPHFRGFTASFLGEVGDFTLPALLLAVRAMIRARLPAMLLSVWVLSCDEAVLITGTSSLTGDAEIVDFVP